MKTFGLFVLSMAAYLTSVYTGTQNEIVAVMFKSLPMATLAVFVQVRRSIFNTALRSESYSVGINDIVISLK